MTVNRTVLYLALFLFSTHVMYHLWQWIAWPPPELLEALYGNSEVSRWIHAATEIVIGLALVLSLRRTYSSTS